MRSICLCIAYRSCFLLLFAVGLNHPRIALADAIVLSFEEARDTCLNQSLESKRASLRREQAVIDHRLARSELYPELNFALVAGEQSRTGKDIVGNERQRGLSASTQFHYRLFDFGRSGARIDQAKLQIEIESLSVDEVNTALTWQLARNYQNYLSAGALVAIARKNREASSAKLASIRRGFEQGLRPENDFISAEADYATTSLELERSEADLILQGRAIEQLMGRPLSPTELGDPSVLPWRSTADWRLLLEGWQKAELSPTQIRRSLEKQNLTNLQKVIEASRRPTLSFQLAAEQELYESERLYSGQLQLTWTLPWNGEFRAEMERIAVEGRSLDIEGAIERRDRENSRALAMDRFQLSSRLAETAEKLRKLRERQYQIGKSRYELGRASALELSSFEVDLGNARLAEARIANELALAALEVAESLQIKDVGSLFRKP